MRVVDLSICEQDSASYK